MTILFNIVVIIAIVVNIIVITVTKYDGSGNGKEADIWLLLNRSLHLNVDGLWHSNKVDELMKLSGTDSRWLT